MILIWILLIFTDFQVFRGMRVSSLKVQPAAPIETFARFQAFHEYSWISLIFIGFRRSGVMDAGRG